MRTGRRDALGGLASAQLRAAAAPAIKAWIKRMAARMPANPVLIRDDFVVKSLTEALA